MNHSIVELNNPCPSESEMASWDALSRDEQIESLRALLNAPEANDLTDKTVDQIFAVAMAKIRESRVSQS